MKFERKIGLILALTALPCIYALLVLLPYVLAHPGGRVPRSISVSLLCLFLLTIVGVSILLSRAAKKEAVSETSEARELRQARAARGLKIGLIVWILILLNDFRMLMLGTVPWIAAIVAMVVITFLIVVSWTSLKRLKNVETSPSDSGLKPRSQP